MGVRNFWINALRRGIPAAVGAMLLMAASDAGASLRAVGPVDPATGYPFSYTDNSALPGITLGPCTNLTFCPAGSGFLPDQIGFESFYWLLAVPAQSTEFPLGPPGAADILIALEASTFPSSIAPPPAIEKDVFFRIRFRLDTTVGGTYTLTHPFGTRVYTNVGVGTRAINDTVDLGLVPNVFDAVLPVFGNGPGNFLAWTPDASTPANFLGNFNIPHTITPGPTGVDYIEVTGPANAFGLGVSTFRATLLELAGQIVGPAAPRIFTAGKTNPMTMTRLSAPVIKTLQFVDPNGDPLAAIANGLPVHCLADNTVAGQVTVTCTPTGTTPQVTTPVTVVVTDNGALSDNVVFSVVVNNLPPTVTPINNKTFQATTGTAVLDNVLVTATDSDGNAIASMNAAIVPTPSGSWFSFDNVARRIITRGPIPTADTNTYTVTVTATDDGATPATGSTSFTVTVGNPPPVVVETGGGGGGGGCAVAGTHGDWKDGAGAFGALLLAAIGIAARRRRI